MDSLSLVTFDFTQGAEAQAPTAAPQAKVFEVAAFNQLMAPAAEQQVAASAGAAGPGLNAVGESSGGSLQSAMQAIDGLNGQFRVLGDKAMEFATQQQELTPSQMLKITVHAQEFLFQSQLTANVANRSAEGIQQLFRQQS